MRDRSDSELVLATYNVHRCTGTDGRHDPERTAAVIRELHADVIALQEVDSGYHIENGLDQIDFLARATGFSFVAGPTLQRHTGTYGNALLTHRPIHDVRQIDLSVPGREPRGAIEVAIEVASDRRLHLIATHLGLRRFERVRQANRILERVIALGDRPIAVLGDFNEWQIGDPSMRPFHARFGRSRLRTFPSRLPLFAIDRVLIEPRRLVQSAHVHRSALARIASDHLPVRAVLDFGALA